MKFLILNILTLALFSCAHHTGTKEEQLYQAHEQFTDRDPASLKLNKGCQSFLSLFFGDPYAQKYQLRNLSFDQAVKSFDENLQRRLPNLKEESKPFMWLQPGNKKTKTVLLLHGWSDSPGTMKEIAKEYYKKGYNVVAPLYSDHGLKDPFQLEAITNSSLRQWRGDVDEFAAIAKALSPDAKIDVAGYSMGSALAMDLSFRFDDLVKSRALFAPLFRENGFVISLGIKVLEAYGRLKRYWGWGEGVMLKDIERGIFYQRMSYEMVDAMHLLTRQIRTRILTRQDDIPTSIFRTDRGGEKTVDNDFIDHVEDEYQVGYKYIFEPTQGLESVKHRDFTSPTLSATGQANPALAGMRRILRNFIDSL